MFQDLHTHTHTHSAFFVNWKLLMFSLTLESLHDRCSGFSALLASFHIISSLVSKIMIPSSRSQVPHKDPKIWSPWIHNKNQRCTFFLPGHWVLWQRCGRTWEHHPSESIDVKWWEKRYCESLLRGQHFSKGPSCDFCMTGSSRIMVGALSLGEQDQPLKRATLRFSHLHFLLISTKKKSTLKAAGWLNILNRILCETISSRKECQTTPMKSSLQTSN